MFKELHATMHHTRESHSIHFQLCCPNFNVISIFRSIDVKKTSSNVSFFT